MAIAAQPPSSASSRVPRAEAVARDLEIEILCDGLSPGERLGTKDDIRQRFGVAVATINEAVRLLEMRGLIEARPGPGGGLFVATSSVRVAIRRNSPQATWGAARYADCLVVRTALEPMVCRDAAAHHDDEDIAAIGRIVDDDGTPLRPARAVLRAELGPAPADRQALPQRAAAQHLPDAPGLPRGRARRDRPARLRRARRRRAHRELVAAIASGPGDRLEAAIAAHAGISAIQRTRRVAGRSRPSAAR